jgi:hypothetical protein
MKRMMTVLSQLLAQTETVQVGGRPGLNLLCAGRHARLVSFLHFRGRALGVEEQMVDLSYLSRIHMEP